MTILLSSFTGFRGWLAIFLVGCVSGICQMVAPKAWDAIVFGLSASNSARVMIATVTVCSPPINHLRHAYFVSLPTHLSQMPPPPPLLSLGFERCTAGNPYLYLNFFSRVRCRKLRPRLALVGHRSLPPCL